MGHGRGRAAGPGAGERYRARRLARRRGLRPSGRWRGRSPGIRRPRRPTGRRPGRTWPSSGPGSTIRPAPGARSTNCTPSPSPRGSRPRTGRSSRRRCARSPSYDRADRDDRTGRVRRAAAAASRGGRADPGGAGRAGRAHRQGDRRARRGERRRPYPHTVRALADALGLDDAGARRRSSTRPGLRRDGAGHPRPRCPAPADHADRPRGRAGEVVAALRSGHPAAHAHRPRRRGQDQPGARRRPRRRGRLPRRRRRGRARAGRRGRAGAADRGPGAQRPTARPSPARLAGRLLGARRQLVVLDNVEHLLDAAADVAELLARCPDLVVLATSRAALRVRAERDHPLGPLPLPTGATATAVADSPAAQVFLDRARAAGRPVALTDATAPAVAAICRAAGRPAAGPRAGRRARPVPPARRTARPAGHRAPARRAAGTCRSGSGRMRATLDWSHDLLTADEQRLLRRLPVFAGGFTLDAAQAVAGEGRACCPRWLGWSSSRWSPERGEAATGCSSRSGSTRRGGSRRPGRWTAWPTAADDFCAAGQERAPGCGVRTKRCGWTCCTGARQPQRDVPPADRGRPPGPVARLGADTWLYWALRGTPPRRGPGWRTFGDSSTPACRPRTGGRAPRAGGPALRGRRRPRHRAAPPMPARGPGTTEVGPATGRGAPAPGPRRGVPGRAGRRRRGADRGRAAGPGDRRRLVLAHTRFAQGQLLFQAGDLDRARRFSPRPRAIARGRGCRSPSRRAQRAGQPGGLTGADDAALEVDGGGRAGRRGRHDLDAGLHAARAGDPRRPARSVRCRCRAVRRRSATAEAASVAVSFPPDLESVEPLAARRPGGAGRGVAGEPGNRARPAPESPAGLADQVRASRTRLM